MNCFPKKPYEAFVAPFLLSPRQIFTQKSNVYEGFDPQNSFIYLLMEKITKFLYLVVYMLNVNTLMVAPIHQQ